MIDLPDWTFGFGLIPRSLYTPMQCSYHLRVSVTIGAKERITIRPGIGFTDEWEWVPAGYVFAVNYAVASIDDNCLIKLEFGEENPQNVGNPKWLGARYGYGSAEFLVGLHYIFRPYTRAVYAVTNYGSTEQYLEMVISGILERV